MKKLAALLILVAAASAAGPLSGRRAASFTLPDASGRFYDLLDYRGKVVILEVMKTDCPHCQTLAKTLERVKTKFGDRIQVISIVNPPDTPQSVAQFIAKFKVTSPIVFDCGQAAAALLKITPQNPSIELPQLLVLDAQGVIREDYIYNDSLKGIFEGDDLIAVVTRLLGGGAAAPAKAPAKK
jgi:peroxiredoxin